ncbi:MAG: hypothetical protein ABFR97_01465 [Thermodesulfobacteriota bacterium]
MMLEKKIKELPVLIEYGAPPELQEQARIVVEKFSHDPMVINILHDFYSHLPEAREDCLEEFFLLAQQEGLLLFRVKTSLSFYYYLVNRELAELVGSDGEGLEERVLSFFGFNEMAAFRERYGDFSDLEPHDPSFLGQQACPACLCGQGQLHTFGCPVEICPWCDGILTNCNCRFDQLGLAKVTSQAQLDTFLAHLEKKGRIPYDAALHSPGYPTAGDSTDD